jgi:hypothetical protein
VSVGVFPFPTMSARARHKKQVDANAIVLQSQGYGFSHDIPARGIPRDIMEMRECVSPYSGRRGQVTEQGLTAIRKRMREARI